MSTFGNMPPKIVNVAYVWTVVLLAIVLYAVTWYVLGSLFMPFVEAIEANYTFPPPLDSTTVFIKNVVIYHPLFALLGWLVWGFLNSQRRSREVFE